MPVHRAEQGAYVAAEAAGESDRLRETSQICGYPGGRMALIRHPRKDFAGVVEPFRGEALISLLGELAAEEERLDGELFLQQDPGMSASEKDIVVQLGLRQHLLGIALDGT